MRAMKGRTKLAGVVLAGTMAFGSGQALAVTDLGFMIDGSGSVGVTDFALQTGGLANALANAGIPTDGSHRITVVQFTGGGTTAAGFGVAPTLINNAADLASVVAQVNAITQIGGGTSFTAAINTAVSAITSQPGYDPNDTQILNLVTDGFAPEPTGAVINAMAQGIDGLSAEAVGAGASTTVLANTVFPVPGVVLNAGDPIPDPLVQGFVIRVNSFADFAPAILAKVQRIVQPPTGLPEPGTLVLMLVGLLGLGAFARRSERVAV